MRYAPYVSTCFKFQLIHLARFGVTFSTNFTFCQVAARDPSKAVEIIRSAAVADFHYLFIHN